MSKRERVTEMYFIAKLSKTRRGDTRILDTRWIAS